MKKTITLLLLSINIFVIAKTQNCPICGDWKCINGDYVLYLRIRPNCDEFYVREKEIGKKGDVSYNDYGDCKFIYNNGDSNVITWNSAYCRHEATDKSPDIIVENYIHHRVVLNCKRMVYTRWTVIKTIKNGNTKKSETSNEEVYNKKVYILFKDEDEGDW